MLHYSEKDYDDILTSSNSLKICLWLKVQTDILHLKCVKDNCVG